MKRPGLFTQILPFTEQQALANSIGATWTGADYWSSVPFPLYSCPSRPYPRIKQAWYGEYFCGDYAWARIGNPDLGPGRPCWGTWTSDGSTVVNYSDISGQLYAGGGNPTGCAPCYRKPVKFYEITDGASTTFIVAEKQLGVQWYAGPNQDNCVYSPGTYGTQADPRAQPSSDSRGAPWCEYFGAAHPQGLNVVWVDGHISLVGYDVSQQAWYAYATRAGGENVAAY